MLIVFDDWSNCRRRGNGLFVLFVICCGECVCLGNIYYCCMFVYQVTRVISTHGIGRWDNIKLRLARAQRDLTGKLLWLSYFQVQLTLQFVVKRYQLVLLVHQEWTSDDRSIVFQTYKTTDAAILIYTFKHIGGGGVQFFWENEKNWSQNYVNGIWRSTHHTHGDRSFFCV